MTVGQLLVNEFERRRTAPDAIRDECDGLAADVKRLDAEIRRLVDAVASGGASVPALVEQMQDKQRAHDAAAARIAQLDALDTPDDFDVVEWLEETRELFDDLRGTLSADPAAGRQVLKWLVTGPIRATPCPDGGWTFEGTASFAKYTDTAADLVMGYAQRPEKQTLRGDVGRPPAEPDTRVQRSCPRGDSNTRHAV